MHHPENGGHALVWTPGGCIDELGPVIVNTFAHTQRTLRVVPSIKGGTSDHVWTLEDTARFETEFRIDPLPSMDVPSKPSDLHTTQFTPLLGLRWFPLLLAYLGRGAGATAPASNSFIRGAKNSLYRGAQE